MNQDLFALVDQLRHDPTDDVTRAAVADLLYDLPARKANLHKIPPWLRYCWIRLVPKPEERRNWPRRDSTEGVLWEMQQCVEAELGPYHEFDHHGITTIADLECFVTDPYPNCRPACDLLRPLMKILPGCAYAYSERGGWNDRTVRGILFPPLVMPPPKTKQKRR
jgi:hypothetical protein